MSQKILFMMMFAFVIALESNASTKVVYGEDNRRDVYETSNPLFLKLAASTSAMVHKSQIYSEGAGFSLNFSRTLETGANICPNEKFAQQPVGSMCSGFLVGPDTLVTAGHCFDLRQMGIPTAQDVCNSFSWVFNYSVNSSSRNPTKNFATQDIYHCKKVIRTALSGTLDYTVIQLDRKVTGREPLKFRTNGKVSGTSRLVVIGHPTGLPTKISDGGKVLINNHPTQFVTNLDTFQGNSGSAVFDASTGLIEGILIQGKTDYTPSIASNEKSCQIVNICNDDGLNCIDDPMNRSFYEPKGETVLRITEVSSFIPTTSRNRNRSK